MPDFDYAQSRSSLTDAAMGSALNQPTTRYPENPMLTRTLLATCIAATLALGAAHANAAEFRGDSDHDGVPNGADRRPNDPTRR